MADPVFTLTVELAVGSMTNVTSWCTRASYSRSVSDLFSPMKADDATFEMINDVGSFSPLLNRGLIPGRKVAFTATHEGSSYNLYAGRVKRLSSRPELGERTTVIEAITEVDRLSRTHLDTGMFINTNAASLFTEIMSRSSVSSFTADILPDTAQFAWYQDTPVTNALDQLLRSGYYQYVIDGAGTHNLMGRYWGVFATSVGTVTNRFDLNYTLSDEDVINKVNLRSLPRQQLSDISTLSYIAQPIVLAAGQHTGFFVGFVDPRDSVSETVVGSIITPVASQDYYGATNSDGTGTDRTSTLSLNIAAFASSAVCSIYNSSADTVYISRFQIRGYPILAGATLGYKSENTSSQNVYGLRERNLESLLFPDQGYLRDFATTIIGDRRNPRDRLELTLKNDWPVLFTHDIGEVVSIVDSFSGVNSTWTVRAVDHDISLMSGLEHTAKMELEFFTERPWLVLDHPTYGKLDSGRQLAL